MNKLIFIVEDHPAQQKILQVHFEETLGNYKVQIFSNPEDLFSHLKENPFAIVLDHFLGEQNTKNGLYYLKALKKAKASIPIIYYTTLNDEAIKDEVMRLGAEQYIIKDSASLVRLRTALDQINAKSVNKKNFFQKLFS